MTSRRLIQRGRRNGAGSTSYGGPGHSFCERHRQRYRNEHRCTECFPGYKPPRLARWR